MTIKMKTGQGAPVVLADKLGSGGEGVVYAMASHPQSVAKIYHQTPDNQKQAKLRAMVRGCDDDLQKIAAWPTETLEQNGAVIGFIMPLLRNCQPVHHLYNPGQRKQFFPQADYAFLVHAARNIAAAFATIHRHGHAVGDVNQGNLVVKADGTVSFIDCDSFQIQVEHKHFLCEVGVAHFTAPELQGQAFAQIVTTPDHDNFGLAVLIFHLLMMGRHPFAGVYSGEGDMPIEQAIKEFRYAYSLRSVGKKMSPPPNSLGTDILSRDISAFFERAFYALNRPTALEWMAVLEEFGAKLKSCHEVLIHKYPAHMFNCPWCQYAEYQRIVFFNYDPKAVRKKSGNKSISKRQIEAEAEAEPAHASHDGKTNEQFALEVGYSSAFLFVCSIFLMAYIIPPGVIKPPVKHEVTKPSGLVMTLPHFREVTPQEQYALDHEALNWNRMASNGKKMGSLSDVRSEIRASPGTWDEDTAVVDITTGLMWTDHVPFAGQKIGWYKARIGFQMGARYEIGVYDDWRLPTAEELKALKRISALIPHHFFKKMSGMTTGDYIWITGDEKEPVSMQDNRSGGKAFNFNNNSYKDGGENYLIFVRGGKNDNSEALLPKP